MSFVRRSLALAGLWWVLSAGDPGSWIVGVPAVLLATLISRHLVPRSGINLLALVRFLPVFLVRSLLAGFDVARRVMTPRLPVLPALVTYDTRLPDRLARVVFLNTVSLLPGTLSADLRGRQLTVHVLDGSHDHAAELSALERRLGDIFPPQSRG